jgi:hypothetical protein
MACKGGVCGRRGRRQPAPAPVPRSPVYQSPPLAINNPTTTQTSMVPTMGDDDMARKRNRQPKQPQQPQKSWWDPLGWFTGPGKTPLTPEQQNFVNQNPNNPMGPIANPIPGTGQSWFNQFAMGRDPQFLQFSPYTPNQQSAMQQMLQMGLAGMQQPNTSFQPIEDYARKQFHEQTIPSLAERFNSAFGQGSYRSSAFPQIMGQQAAGLESQLAAMRSQHNLGLLPFYQNMAGMGLTPQYESIYAGGGPGTIHAAARGIGQALPYAAMAMM